MNKIKKLVKKNKLYPIYRKLIQKKQSLVSYICSKNIEIKKLYIKRKFFKAQKYKLSFDSSPKTMMQKIQYRKIYDKNPLYSICSDKYEVRKYVEKKVGSKYLIPLLFVGEKIKEKDIANLPNKFVLKANHISSALGKVYLIKNKNEIITEIPKIVKDLNKQLKKKFGEFSMETWYDDIKPMIIAEELLEDENGEIPKDYKFHCFKDKNGKVRTFLAIDYDRSIEHGRQVYDEDFNMLDMKFRFINKKIDIKRPENFEEMKKISKKLSEDFDYVRVDLYTLKNKIYFGELTFAEGSGFGRMEPSSWDEKFGGYWDLNLKK